MTDRAIAKLLTEMDGVEELKGVTVLAATTVSISSMHALLRAGRFDFLLELPMPDADARLAIFQVHTTGKPLAGDIDLQVLAGADTIGRSGADIELICKKASIAAIREFLASGDPDLETLEGFAIRADHFRAAVRESVRTGRRESCERETETLDIETASSTFRSSMAMPIWARL